MTPRSIRRAAERKDAKQALKADRQSFQPMQRPTTETPTATSLPTPSSVAQFAANRANSQLSTGPKTDAGKLVSSRNAVKTGLTGQTVLLPTDDIAAYEALTTQFVNKYNPAGLEEVTLVQSLIDTTWRLQRIPRLEFGIYALGSLEFADCFDHLEPAARNQMIQLETYLKYEKSLRNLNTQESRLQRHLAKDTRELQNLQEERRQQKVEVPASLPLPQPAPEFGFEFSNGQAAPESATTAPVAPATISPAQAMSEASAISAK